MLGLLGLLQSTCSKFRLLVHSSTACAMLFTTLPSAAAATATVHGWCSNGTQTYDQHLQAQNATPDLSQNPFKFLMQSSKEDAAAAKEEVRLT